MSFLPGRVSRAHTRRRLVPPPRAWPVSRCRDLKNGSQHARPRSWRSRWANLAGTRHTCRRTRGRFVTGLAILLSARALADQASQSGQFARDCNIWSAVIKAKTANTSANKIQVFCPISIYCARKISNDIGFVTFKKWHVDEVQPINSHVFSPTRKIKSSIMAAAADRYWRKRFVCGGPRKIALDRQAPRIYPRMIPLCSRFDSVLFTPKMSSIASYSNFSRSPVMHSLEMCIDLD
jgi:hypothetical protein